MDLEKNKIPGVDISNQSPCLMPESFYDDDDLEYYDFEMFEGGDDNWEVIK